MALPHFGCNGQTTLRIEKPMETSLISLITALLPDLPPVQIDKPWLEAQFPVLRDLEILSSRGFKFVYSVVHPVDGDVVLKLI